METKYSRKSLVCSALVLPAGLVAGKLVELVLKFTNPMQVDITAGLAYLGHILITSSIVIIGLLIAALVFAGKAKENNEDVRLIHLAFVMVAVVIGFTVMLGAMNNATDRITDKARINRIN